MKLDELLNENIEDEQAEANERAVTLLMMAKTFMNKSEFSQYEKAWKHAVKNFSDGYEEDNDNLMYGGLDDLEGVGDELEDPVKDYFEDDFEAKYKQFAERTHEFQSGKSVDFGVSADETMKQAHKALADYRKKKAAEKG